MTCWSYTAFCFVASMPRLESSASRARHRWPQDTNRPTLTWLYPWSTTLWAGFSPKVLLAMHEVEKSALMLIKLLDVQPFDEANGRTLRLFSNFFLLKAGYPPAIIPASQADQYAVAIQRSLGFDTQPIIDLIAEADGSGSAVVSGRTTRSAKAQSLAWTNITPNQFFVLLFPLFQLNIARPMRGRPNSLHILRLRYVLACVILGLLPAKVSSAQNSSSSL